MPTPETPGSRRSCGACRRLISLSSASVAMKPRYSFLRQSHCQRLENVANMIGNGMARGSGKEQPNSLARCSVDNERTRISCRTERSLVAHNDDLVLE